MSRLYKNKVGNKPRANGIERRRNLAKEVLQDSSPLPQPVVYKDIDKAFHEWVDKELDISFEGKRLPTMDLYSNQRFSEYMQAWEFTDENKNVMLNFKTVTRESDPQSGSINEAFKNIPGEPTFLMNKVEARDKNDRKYYIEYRMKQPMSVDLLYRVGLLTNKYELLNEFNLKIQDKFKSIDCYIRPNGHYMSMTLDSISDDSAYDIDDRQFYSQTCVIKVRAYIIQENDFQVVEVPDLRFKGFEGERRKRKVEIEELSVNDCPQNDYRYVPVVISTCFTDCNHFANFTLDSDFWCDFMQNITYNDGKETDNGIISLKLTVNDTQISLPVEGFHTVTENDKNGKYADDPRIIVGMRIIDFRDLFPKDGCLILKEGDVILVSGLKIRGLGNLEKIIFRGQNRNLIYNADGEIVDLN